jgi:hypothetical protein
MTRRNQLRLIFHGALVLTLSMVVETPGLFYAFSHGTDDLVRFYLRQAHSVLMATGIWMIATGMALPLLELTERGISWLAWSLVFTAYTFALAIGVFIAELIRQPLIPQQYPTQISQLETMPWYVQWLNLLCLAATGITSLLAALLIVRGALMATRHSPTDDIH